MSLEDFGQNIKAEEPSKEEKAEAWQAAIGLQVAENRFLASHSGVDVAYKTMQWGMADFCLPQQAAKIQDTTNAVHSEALRLPSDLQRGFIDNLYSRGMREYF